jgi:hypothetical protein
MVKNVPTNLPDKHGIPLHESSSLEGSPRHALFSLRYPSLELLNIIQMHGTPPCFSLLLVPMGDFEGVDGFKVKSVHHGGTENTEKTYSYLHHKGTKGHEGLFIGKERDQA